MRVATHQSVVVDTSRSPAAKLRPVALEAVRLADGFWAPRLKMVREVTLPSQYQFLEDTGRLTNFRRAAGKVSGDFEGIYFNDSDVYKWLEAGAFALAYEPDAELARLMDGVVGDVAAAQQPDGYLNTYFMFEHESERWTNLRDMHELYCAGHLFQAAVAHHRATGEDRLLAVARRFADLIASVFRPGGRPGTPGHPEPEMALVELYRETGERRYLETAQYFLDQRGHGVIGGSSYHQDHRPFRDLTEITGHAVRSLYLNAGATDVVLETGSQTLWRAVERLWFSLTERRMYVTGGAGARHEGEAFGEDYELPDRRAYAETCAAIANVMWNWRMLLATGYARHADVMELALYNGALAGISLDGTQYFYVNPLSDRGGHRRQEWFGCACCPPNIARLLASMPGYLYSTSDEGVWVHLYVAGTATFDLGGSMVGLRQRAEPDTEIEVSLEEGRNFTLFLRIPGWAERCSITVNEQEVGVEAVPGTYAEVRREWRDGDRVQMVLRAGPEVIAAHPWVEGLWGRVAIRRGPFIYCVEQADLPDCDVWDLVVDRHLRLEGRWREDLLGGIAVVEGTGTAPVSRPWAGSLYLPYSRTGAASRPVRFTAIPYYAWANREPGPMRVWLPMARR